MIGFCPSCGFNFSRDVMLEAGPISWSPTNGITFDGEPIIMTPQESLLVQTVMRAYPKVAPTDAIIGRIDSASTQSLRVVLFNARLKFWEATRQRLPVATQWGSGLRWIGCAVKQVSA